MSLDYFVHVRHNPHLLILILWFSACFLLAMFLLSTLLFFIMCCCAIFVFLFYSMVLPSKLKNHANKKFGLQC